MDLSDFSAQVGAIPMLQSLPEEIRRSVIFMLLKVASRTDLGKGDILYLKGAEDRNTGALLVEGEMHVETDDGDPLLVVAPELLGEMQQFNEFGQRVATVKAATDAIVLEFSWNDFVATAIGPDSLTRSQQLLLKDAFTGIAGERLKELAAHEKGHSGTAEDGAGPAMEGE